MTWLIWDNNVNHFIFEIEKYESRREKTGFLHIRKQRRRSALGNREADQRLCFSYIDSTIPIFPNYEISSL